MKHARFLRADIDPLLRRCGYLCVLGAGGGTPGEVVATAVDLEILIAAELAAADLAGEGARREERPWGQRHHLGLWIWNIEASN